MLHQEEKWSHLVSAEALEIRNLRKENANSADNVHMLKNMEQKKITL